MSNHPALLVLAIAVAAPLLAEIPIGVRLPALVLEMMLGIVVGPHVLGLASADTLLEWIGGRLGLAALSSWQGWSWIWDGFGVGRYPSRRAAGSFRSHWAWRLPDCYTCCRSCTRRSWSRWR